MQRRSASLRTAWKSPQQSSRSGRTLCRRCSSSSVSYILSKAPWQHPATATFIAAAPPARRRRAPLARHRAPLRHLRAGGADRPPRCGRPLQPGPSYRQAAARAATGASARPRCLGRLRPLRDHPLSHWPGGAAALPASPVHPWVRVTPRAGGTCAKAPLRSVEEQTIRRLLPRAGSSHKGLIHTQQL